MAEARIAVSRRLEPEDQARADFYALLARLYARAPDAALLAAIAGAAPLAVVAHVDEAGDNAVALARAWDRLRAASAAMEAAAAAQEYDDLFVGVGMVEANLHASHWIAGAMMQKPLADVRAALAALGLARKPEVAMVEDHLAALFETMRMLVAGDGHRAPEPVARQREFFDRHIAGWVDDCCAAIGQNSVANYYRAVAKLTSSFVALERDSFAIE
jgi:TorA maturation chaperone TorD